jgi:hypothetical protein
VPAEERHVAPAERVAFGHLGGAVYIPSGAISFSGGDGTSMSCTQIIGDTVSFTGNSALAISCSSYKTKPFSARVLKITS